MCNYMKKVYLCLESDKKEIGTMTKHVKSDKSEVVIIRLNTIVGSERKRIMDIYKESKTCKVIEKNDGILLDCGRKIHSVQEHYYIIGEILHANDCCYLILLK